MRKDLLQLAESFLNSDNVKDADKEKKTEFLKTKGLNDEEIEEAFRRVNSSKDKVCFKSKKQIVFFFCIKNTYT